DSGVQALFLELDGLAIGWGKLDELRRAIADFRASGKKAYAYLESGETKDYLVALACDEAGMPESGWLMLTGVRGQVTFYKDLFEKIGVKADMLQMGDFKGAAEPFTRSSMSPQFRKQFESVLDDYYEKSLVEAILRARPERKWTAEQVKKLIDEGPYTARAAAGAGLIDRVAYRDQFERALKTPLNAERVKVTKNYGKAKGDELDFSNPFSMYVKLMEKMMAAPKLKLSFAPKIAVIYATGPIVSGKGGEEIFGDSTVGSTTMVEAIRKAEQDPTVKAIVLRVDSPGGSALASDLIWNELAKSKKPVVASMSDVAASGGYYISMAAKKIYAEPGTLTGSIGVVGGKLVIGGLEDKIGLKTETISRGANANILSSTTPFSDSERKAWTGMMKDVYEQFLSKALAGRKKAGKQMTHEELEKLAGGRIWTGRQAQANGLIDEGGTLQDAIAAAKEMGGIAKGTEPELMILPKAKTIIEQFLESRTDAQLPLHALRQLPLLRDWTELSRHLRSLDGMLRLRGEPVWLILPHRVEIR